MREPVLIAREHLGRLFRERRLKLGLTQEAVAHRLEIEEPDYRRIELGKRGFSLEMLAKIAIALELEPTAFFVAPSGLDRRARAPRRKKP